MIATCCNCRHGYWRYKPDWETPGFCSWLCFELYRDERVAGNSDDPGIPAGILQVLISHNRIVHHTADPTAWPECGECERLEARLAAAIAYHLPAIPAEMTA